MLFTDEIMLSVRMPLMRQADMVNQDDKSPQRKANQKDGVSIDTIKSQLKAIQDVARGADRGGLQRV